MNEIEQLQEQMRRIEAKLEFILSERFEMTKDLYMSDGRNLEFAVGTGTKIGTATGQKLSFYGVTPVDQPDAIADPTGGGVQDTECRAVVNTIIDRLFELGLIA